MNPCAKDLNPFRSIVASILFFCCKLEMIQFDKAGLHIHHVRFTCYRFLCVFSSKCIEEKIHLKYSVYIQTTLTLHIWTVCPYHLGYFGNWNHTIFFEQNVKMSARFEEESHIQSINIVLLATIYLFGGVQAVFFGGRQRVLLGKPRFNKRGCFPSILSCRYTFPGPGDSALPFGTGENPLWFGIQSHLLCGFSPTIFSGTRYSAKSKKNSTPPPKKKKLTVDELDPRILNHLEMYQTPQNHSDITSNSPRKMKQRSWRELKCCEISGYLDAWWSKSWLGGKWSSKWKKPCWLSISVICHV